MVAARLPSPILPVPRLPSRFLEPLTRSAGLTESTPAARAAVTRLLVASRPDASEGERCRLALFERLYGELRALARRMMGGERRGHTLTPTALVHEAFLRLVDESRLDAADRGRFFGIAARAMRQVLVDHARARDAAKRGGGWRRVTLDDGVRAAEDEGFDVLALDSALASLAGEDARAAQVTEMHVFAGLSLTEIADVLGVSRRTVNGDWAYARRWLSRALQEA